MAVATADRVVVVGAGIGGLVAALLLNARGLGVTLVEAGTEPGGKMRAVRVDGVAIDAGPTVFTMRWVFDEILAELGASLDALVKLEPLSVLGRHAWRSNPERTLDLHADAQRSADAIAAFASPAEARRFTAFCDEARRIYRRLEGPHIRSSRPGLLQMAGDLGPRGLRELAALGPFATLCRTLGKRFRDPRLVQLFARYATYCGSSPWAAPATLMLVADVEMQGVWSIDGGMHTLAQRLADLAQRRGVVVRYGQAVQQIVIDAGRARGAQLSSGERLDADAVVFNGDADALAQGLLGHDVATRLRRKPLAPTQRSLSALTWAMHTPTQGFAPSRHNVFFDDDYASEFSDVFNARRLPRRGTVYLCAQDRLHDGTPRSGPERLLALVNAPADADRAPLDEMETESCLQRSLALMQHCGLTLAPQPATTLRRGPTQFHQLFPGSGGALYGEATHGWMALFRRPGAATAIPGLYLAGGSVHPGPGVPMAAMSGRLAAATLLAHLGSTQASSRVRIAGGTSMPSATMPATR